MSLDEWFHCLKDLGITLTAEGRISRARVRSRMNSRKARHMAKQKKTLTWQQIEEIRKENDLLEKKLVECVVSIKYLQGILGRASCAK